MYFVFHYFKYKHNKTGSYDVQGRHKPRPRVSSTATELATASVHSSFRDITEQYNRERVLEGIAELGCTGELRRNQSLGSVVVEGLGRDGSEASTCGLVTVSIHDQDEERRDSL